MKFNTLKANDFCDSVRDGTHDSPRKVEKGYKLITSKNIREYGLDLENASEISEEDFNKVNARSLVEKNDILYSMIGTIGLIHRVDYIPNYAIKNIGLFKIKDENKSKWLFYYLKTPKMRNYINSLLAGSTQQYITLNNLRELPIQVPENISDMNKTLHILEIIDKKITYNMHTNNNLYEIGKALYQEYFENEEYTNNYEIRQLREVTTNNRNKIDQTKEYKVLSAVNTGNLVLSDDYFDKQVYSKDIGKYLNVNKNDFAYNPARINIGSIGLNTFDFNCCVSPVYVTFSVDKDYIDFFDFYFKSKRFNAEVTLRASGSVRQALNYNDFGMIEIPYPTKEMIEKFNSSYKTIKERININKTKISNLEQLRDTLLPKLMNGEIDLDKIEI